MNETEDIQLTPVEALMVEILKGWLGIQDEDEEIKKPVRLTPAN